MSTEQPLALQLAEELEQFAYFHAREAAAELRRQHARITELLEASMKVLEWFEAEDDHSKADFYQRMQMCHDAEEMIRAAISKATDDEAFDDFDEDVEDNECHNCSGTGEGMYDGQSCVVCRGKGVL
jgi:hypothetical protein